MLMSSVSLVSSRPPVHTNDIKLFIFSNHNIKEESLHWECDGLLKFSFETKPNRTKNKALGTSDNSERDIFSLECSVRRGRELILKTN